MRTEQVREDRWPKYDEIKKERLKNRRKGARK
jgi:hypothetical protein